VDASVDFDSKTCMNAEGPTIIHKEQNNVLISKVTDLSRPNWAQRERL